MPAGLLQLITAAVTPVAMISSAAIIIGAVSGKHQSMSDRLRALASEYRDLSTTDDRRANICLQMGLFNRRIRYSANAHRLLYLAIASFTFTVLLIIASPSGLTWTPAAAILFASGVALMLVAVVFEFIELWWTNQTLRLEMSDVLCFRPSAPKAAATERVERG